MQPPTSPILQYKYGFWLPYGEYITYPYYPPCIGWGWLCNEVVGRCRRRGGGVVVVVEWGKRSARYMNFSVTADAPVVIGNIIARIEAPSGTMIWWGDSGNHTPCAYGSQDYSCWERITTGTLYYHNQGWGGVSWRPRIGIWNFWGQNNLGTWGLLGFASGLFQYTVLVAWAHGISQLPGLGMIYYYEWKWGKVFHMVRACGVCQIPISLIRTWRKSGLVRQCPLPVPKHWYTRCSCWGSGGRGNVLSALGTPSPNTCEISAPSRCGIRGRGGHKQSGATPDIWWQEQQ